MKVWPVPNTLQEQRSLWLNKQGGVYVCQWFLFMPFPLHTATGNVIHVHCAFILSQISHLHNYCPKTTPVRVFWSRLVFSSRHRGEAVISKHLCWEVLDLIGEKWMEKGHLAMNKPPMSSGLHVANNNALIMQLATAPWATSYSLIIKKVLLPGQEMKKLFKKKMWPIKRRRREVIVLFSLVVYVLAVSLW